MKLRKIIRYLEIIDRQLEILYINFSKAFEQSPTVSLFWKELSVEKGDLYSCLSLIEQVGEEKLVISEYQEDEFICVMEKLTRYIRESLRKAFSLEQAIEMAVEMESEHYVKIFNHMSNLVDGDFKQVIREMDHNKQARNSLREFTLLNYPEGETRKKLIAQMDKSFK